MMDGKPIFHHLLERVKRGEDLEAAERQYVRNALRSMDADDDPYTLIHILWKAGDDDDAGLIAEFLSHGDEMLRRIALQAMSQRWPSEMVFDVAIRAFEHDGSTLVRLAAASSIGDIGARLPHLSSVAARVLLNRYDARLEAADVEWEACYDGLMNLLDIPQSHRPAGIRQMGPEQVDPAIIASATRLARGRLS